MILKDHNCSLYKLYFFRILAHYGVWQVRIFPIRGSDSNIALHTYTHLEMKAAAKKEVKTTLLELLPIMQGL